MAPPANIYTVRNAARFRDQPGALALPVQHEDEYRSGDKRYRVEDDTMPTAPVLTIQRNGKPLVSVDERLQIRDDGTGQIGATVRVHTIEMVRLNGLTPDRLARLGYATLEELRRQVPGSLYRRLWVVEVEPTGYQ